MYQFAQVPVLLLILCEGIKVNAMNFSNHVEEIQHAICKIATEDIEASANATMTRQLKGVCTTKEMHSRLDHLERIILHEINAIKQALGLETHTIPTTIDDIQIRTKSLESSNDLAHSTYTDSIKITKTHNVKIKTRNSTAKPLNSPLISYQRDLKAAKYNATVQVTDLGKSFLYYWKIYDIQDVFAQPEDTHIDSPTFYLTGHPLRIKLYPRHLGTSYVALTLAGGAKFAIKHHFTILNQVSEQADLTSQTLGVNAPLFRISSKRIRNGNFTNDGSLLIKATLALKS